MWIGVESHVFTVKSVCLLCKTQVDRIFLNFEKIIGFKQFCIMRIFIKHFCKLQIDAPPQIDLSIYFFNDFLRNKCPVQLVNISYEVFLYFRCSDADFIFAQFFILLFHLPFFFKCFPSDLQCPRFFCYCSISWHLQIELDWRKFSVKNLHPWLFNLHPLQIGSNFAKEN